jgi:potassium-transporting ATPase potassium-binding subunit
MSWKEYFFALFLMDSVVLIFVIMILTLQNYIPLSDGKGGLSIDLVFDIAIGFITDTDL